jgi:FdhE protein
MNATPRLAERVSRPECEPWLALLRQAFAPGIEQEFGRMVTGAPRQRAGQVVPLLTGMTIAVDPAAVRRYLDGLLTAAARVSGAGGGAAPGEADTLSLLEAAITQETPAMARVAASTGLDPDLLRAVAPVVAMPVLQASRRAWSPQVSPHWSRPFCPICGAWPGLAEVRGLDRTRRFRCLRCASDWHAEWLMCPYCENREHTRLGALVSADDAETRKAETCTRCFGYVKSVTTLQASEASQLGLLDVETIELDVAAIEHGYSRPDEPGHPLDVRVEPKRARRVIGWRW